MGSTTPRTGRLAFAVAAVCFFAAAVFAGELVTGHFAVVFSDTVFPVTALAAGTLLVVAAMRRTGRDRVAWLLFGAGMISAGLGETLWAWYELGLGYEPPFPGPPDVFYLAANPLFALGLMMAPRIDSSPFQWVRQGIDAVVLTAGVSIVAWTLILEPMYAASSGMGTTELAVAGAYPIGDMLLIATAGSVGLRRSAHLRSRSLWCVVAAVVATAAGDVIYLVQTWNFEYETGTWLDSMWIIGYGFFALAAAWLGDELEPRPLRDRRLPLWQILVPVGVLFGLAGLRIAAKVVNGPSDSVVFDLILTALGVLVVVRILLSVAEDRYLVDVERKQLISVVSHELRTPLTAVHGYLDLLQSEWDEFDDAGRREMVATSGEQARVVTRIVTDLVAASRDQLHSVDLLPEMVHVSGVAEEAVAALGIAASTSVVAEPGSVVVADRERLRQILTNLLSNAERYGRGTIVCLARPVNGSVEIAVHDDGPGVPTRHRHTIWGRFERGAHRFDATTPGSGLGLAIVKSLVAAHGGQAGYRPSALLGGACFWVKLPRAGARPEDEMRIEDLAPARS